MFLRGGGKSWSKKCNGGWPGEVGRDGAKAGHEVCEVGFVTQTTLGPAEHHQAHRLSRKLSIKSCAMRVLATITRAVGIKRGATPENADGKRTMEAACTILARYYEE